MTSSQLSRLDIHVRELLRGTFSAVAYRTVGMVTSFLLTIIFARILGSHDFGIFTLASTCILVATVIGRFGLENALLKFASASVTKQKWNEVAAIFRLSINFALATSAIITAALLILAPVLAIEVFGEAQLIYPIRILSLTVVPSTLVILHGEIFKAFKNSSAASFLQSTLPPAAMFATLAIAVVMVGTDLAASDIAWVSVGAAFGTILTAILFKRNFIPQIRSRRGEFNSARLLHTSIPLFWIALMGLVLGATDTIMLGIWTPPEQVALYSAAAKLASLVSFPLVAVNTIAAPMLAGLYASGDLRAVNSVVRTAVIITLALSVPVSLLYWLWPGLPLMLFGQAFLPASGALILLTMGQFVNAATGPVGNLLMMTGHEKLMRNNIACAALLNTVLNALLIPEFGITGAAIATALCLGIMNLISLYLVRRFVGVSLIPIFGRG